MAGSDSVLRCPLFGQEGRDPGFEEFTYKKN